MNSTVNFVLGRVTGNLSIYLRVRRRVLEQGLNAMEDNATEERTLNALDLYLVL